MPISNGNVFPNNNNTNSPIIEVIVASTANINLISAPATIDSYGSLVSGTSTILVKDQTTPSQNGVYIWNGAGNAMTYFASLSTWTSYIGLIVYVQNGTINSETNWRSTAQTGGTLGTTPLNFVKQSGIYSANGAIELVNSDIFQLKTLSALTSNWINGVDSDGNFLRSQPATSDINGLTTALGLLAPLASPTFTGTPLTTTPATNDNSTKIASTAYVQNLIANKIGNGTTAIYFSATAPNGGNGSINAPYNSLTGVTYTSGNTLIFIEGDFSQSASVTTHTVLASNVNFVGLGSAILPPLIINGLTGISIYNLTINNHFTGGSPDTPLILENINVGTTDKIIYFENCYFLQEGITNPAVQFSTASYGKVIFRSCQFESIVDFGNMATGACQIYFFECQFRPYFNFAYFINFPSITGYPVLLQSCDNIWIYEFTHGQLEISQCNFYSDGGLGAGGTTNPVVNCSHTTDGFSYLNISDCSNVGTQSQITQAYSFNKTGNGLGALINVEVWDASSLTNWTTIQNVLVVSTGQTLNGFEPSTATIITANGNDTTGKPYNSQFPFKDLQPAFDAIPKLFGLIHAYARDPFSDPTYGDLTVADCVAITFTATSEQISAGNLTLNCSGSTGINTCNFANFYWNLININNSSSEISGNNIFMGGGAQLIKYTNSSNAQYGFKDYFINMTLYGGLDFFSTGTAQTNGIEFYLQQCVLPVDQTIKISGTATSVIVYPDCVGITPDSFVFSGGATIAQVIFKPVQISSKLNKFIQDYAENTNYVSSNTTGNQQLFGGGETVVNGGQFASITVNALTASKFNLTETGTYKVVISGNWFTGTTGTTCTINLTPAKITVPATSSATTKYSGTSSVPVSTPLNYSANTPNSGGEFVRTDYVTVTDVTGGAVTVQPTFDLTSVGSLEGTLNQIIYRIEKIS